MARQAIRKARLDKKRCDAFKPAASRYRVTDAEVRPLKFVVEPSGNKYWSVRYVTNAGKNSETVLGAWPGLQLVPARKQAQEIIGKVYTQNEDPAAINRETRERKKANQDLEATRKANSFEVFAARYLTASRKGLFGRGNRRKAASTLEKEEQHLGKHVLPALGSKPVSEIRRRDILNLRDKLAEAGTPGAANSCVEVVRRVLAFALEREATEANVALGVPILPMAARQVVATEDQLKRLWAALETTRGSADAWASATILELALVTMQRRGEIAAISEDEIDWAQALWTIPASRKKERRAAKVPLSQIALELLRDAFARSGGNYAFPSRGGATTPIRPKTVTRFMARLRERLPGIGEITPHDLRRTARTALTGERLGIDADTAERVLNHLVGSAQARTYDVNSYLPQKRRALDAWAAELRRIVAGEEPPSNVVSMHATQV